MATRKPTEETTDSALAEAVRSALLGDDTFNSEELLPALESLYAELDIAEGADATVHISKLNADGKGGEANVWKGPPSDYDLEAQAKIFGSGDYRVRVYVGSPGKPKVVRGNKVISWLLSPEQEARRVSKASLPSEQTLGQTVAQAVAEAMRGFMPLVQQAQQPQMNPMEMIKMSIDMAKAMQPPPSNSDPMAIMAATLGMMRDMREMESDREPIERGTNATTADVILSAMNKFLPLAGQILTQGQQAQPQQIPYPQITGPEDQAPHVQDNPMPQQAQNEDIAKIRQGLGMLKMMARMGAAPDNYVGMIFDTVPDAELRQLLSVPDPLGQLAAIDPELMTEPCKTWFGELLRMCKEDLDAPSETAAA